MRHVAVRALLRFGRIVKRTRALAGNAARLPVVVVVEAAQPAVIVDGNVQVNLVAGRAKLRNLLRILVKRLQEDVAVRLGIQSDGEVGESVQIGILAGGKAVEERIFNHVVALAHGAFHLHDGVARHAAQSRLPFRRLLDFADGAVLHHAGKNQGVIVAASAPERRLDAVHVLHVLNRFAIPLVVERRHVVHRTLPLVIDVRMAGLAGFRVQEELRLDGLAIGGLRGAGKGQAALSPTFVLHAQRSGGGIVDDVRGLGTARW